MKSFPVLKGLIETFALVLFVPVLYMLFYSLNNYAPLVWAEFQKIVANFVPWMSGQLASLDAWGKANPGTALVLSVAYFFALATRFKLSREWLSAKYVVHARAFWLFWLAVLLLFVAIDAFGSGNPAGGFLFMVITAVVLWRILSAAHRRVLFEKWVAIRNGLQKTTLEKKPSQN